MSESAVECVDDSFNKSDRPLPEPPLGRRRVALGSLLTVAVSALFVAFLLLPNALYAMRSGGPQELGPLASASLAQAESWVSATGTPEPTALRFSRFGARGSFRLTQVKDRKEVWLLFQVPSSIEVEFVPPTHFVGRFRRLREPGLLPAEVRDAIAPNSSQTDEFVLVDGESPASQKPSLFAAILLSLLAAACVSSAFFLWRKVE